MKTEDLFAEYADRFDENFPVFAPMPKGKTVEDVLKECLAKGKPYVPQYRKGKVY